MEVQYKCKCILKHVTVEVERRNEGEDILAWFERAILPVLSKHHRTLSPHCTETKVEELRFPMEADTPIGMKKKTPQVSPGS